MSSVEEGSVLDAAAPDLVSGQLGGFRLLRPFNQAGVLAPADVHTATRLCRLAGESDEEVALAVALAVRAPRVGHVSVDLADIRSSAVEADEETDLDVLPWPETEDWIRRVGASGLVDADPGGSTTPRPLRLSGRSLYLDRYWRDEASVAAEILSRVGVPGDGPGDGARPVPVDSSRAGTGYPSAGDGGGEAEKDVGAGSGDDAIKDVSEESTEECTGESKGESTGESTGERLGRLFPGAGSSDQLSAARLVLATRFAVVAGGPGTGKTTTVARLLALLFEDAQARGVRSPLVGLAAPTGKAAARMEEAVRSEATRIDTPPEVRAALREVTGSTLHRLLGTRFDRPGHFRHHRAHRLPHDVVIVDEASMVSLSLMARLMEAVRPDARLVLVGDPEQLVSVEAGAVLADIVGPAGGQPADGVASEAVGRMSGVGQGSETLGQSEPTPVEPVTPAAIGSSICLLRRNHRFAGTLARLSSAVRMGDDAEVLAILSGGDPDLAWVDAEPTGLLFGGGGQQISGPLDAVRSATVEWATAVHHLAAGGEVAEALAHLRRYRVLCAHRRGSAGVRAWNQIIEGWSAAAGAPAQFDTWYAGRPVMLSVNDYALRLYNGDTGVAVAVPSVDSGSSERRLAVAFDEGEGRPARMVSPTRMTKVETVYAMTVHKSQGSEFEQVTLLLPPAGSRLLTRELLYTAITRARRAVTVVGTAEAVAAAVRTPIARASGLGERLWGEAGR